MSNGETSSYTYNLEKELTFSKGGEFEKTSSLEMAAPSMAEYDEVADLSQAVMSAMMNAAKANLDMDKEAMAEAAAAGDVSIEPGELRMAMMSSPGVKVTSVAKKFRQLAVKVGTCDGSSKLKDSHLNKLSITDFDGLMFGYIAAFICPSLLSAGEGSTVEEDGSN